MAWRSERGKGSRPKAECPGCKRDIAVTFNKLTGDAYLRSHVVRPGEQCSMSRRVVRRSRFVDALLASGERAPGPEKGHTEQQ